MAERRGQQGRDVLGLVVGDLEAVGPAVAGDGLLGRQLGLVGDAVRRVGPDQVRLGRLAEDPADIGGVGGVAAQQAVVAQGVEVAATDGRLVREVRGVIRIDEAGASDVDAVLSGQVVEQRSERVIGGLESVQQGGEGCRFGISHRADRIERRQDQPPPPRR